MSQIYPTTKEVAHIFITGGASGIGLQLARDYAGSGCAVTLFDIQPTQGAVAELSAIPEAGPVRAFAMDVCDPAQVRKVIAEAAAEQGPDLVIHCAGICIAAPFEEISDEAYTRLININLLGSRHVAAAVLPYLQSGSQLAFVASIAGLLGCYGYSAYCAAKYGVVGLAEVLRIELAPRGIAVSLVCPPEVETPLVVEERKNRPKQTETLKLMAGTLPVEYAVEQIRRGIDRRRFLIIPGKRARLLWFTNKLLPGSLTRRLTDFLVSR
ncbi:Short-chain dehydrogenase [Marinobacter gudaonensis]|uniref:3-dehydrosphinganine reductase n=1 Tax=Marinobacter gudaonensis TaxID=375760 RepID=A0A1I6GGT3_9GAMM|nr:SDR family oxidoreductase [Marinobacter gudaonensis]SFR41414.1 Short-chain dehydrogenase [Marinobacter gudaonensis]